MFGQPDARRLSLLDVGSCVVWLPRGKGGKGEGNVPPLFLRAKKGRGR